MSDFRTIQEYTQYQEETAIPKLRWLQVTELANKYSNDQEFGGEVRKLIKKCTMDFENVVAMDEFGMEFDQLGENEQEWVLDHIENCLS